MEQKKKKNKTVILILQILAFILLASGVFYGTYYLFMDKSTNSYEDKIKKLVDKVNEVNESVSSFSEGQALKDMENIRKQLPSKVDTLSGIKQDAVNLIATDKYKKDHDSFLSGLDNNILIYRQIDAVLRNPEGSDIDKAIEDLQKYTDDTTRDYSLFNIQNLKVTLPASTITFINNVATYTNEMIKLNREKEIIQSKNQEFIDSLDSITPRFVAINLDFPSEISKVRTEKGNIDNVIAIANKNMDELEDIRRDFTNITVPENAVATHKSFAKVLENYEKYIQSFIFAANNEKLLEEEPSAQKINEIYSDTASKFTAVNKSYNDFIKTYDQFK